MKTIYIKNILFASVFVFSCTQIPEEYEFVSENISPIDPVSISINVIGSKWNDDFLKITYTTKNSSRRDNSLKMNELQ